MSVHNSLVPKSTLQRGRNVYTRAERLQILAKDGLWDEEKSVFGLPKVKTVVVEKGGKKKKKAPEAEAAAGGEAVAAPTA